MSINVSDLKLLFMVLVRGMGLIKKIGSRSRVRKSLKRIAIEKVRTEFAVTSAQILKIDDFFVEEIKMAALRPAVRLILYIMVKQSVTIKQALHDSPLSYRAFYIMLEKLKDDAWLEVRHDDEDRRVRRLVLGRKFENMLAKLPSFMARAEPKIPPVK